jgi:hypothetical protein
MRDAQRAADRCFVDPTPAYPALVPAPGDELATGGEAITLAIICGAEFAGIAVVVTGTAVVTITC